jgi:acetyltransferase-like isoleucine patch superfamily enzyme
MTLRKRLRRGEGPVWSRLRRLALASLSFHLPVNKFTRPVFRALYASHVFIREGWIWTRRFFWNEPLFRSQCESVGAGFQMETLPYLTGRGRIVIGENVRLSGKSSIAFGGNGTGDPELVIGDGTFIGHGCGFNIQKSVRIGRNCLLASGVLIYDADGHPLDADRRRNGESSPPEQIGAVTIGDDVWIGSGARILNGVTIGDRSVVGAGSVVTRDTPADSISAGNPARVIREVTSATVNNSPMATCA